MEETKDKDYFKDAEGLEWRPLFGTATLLEICRACNVTIGNLAAMNINIGDMGEALWIACRYQAKERSIDRETFFARVSPSILPGALAACWVCIKKAFPAMEDFKLDPKLADKLPFGLGKSGT